jgi:hypothetical protein
MPKRTFLDGSEKKSHANLHFGISAGDYTVNPASPLVLTTEQHALIGETVEILGWTDHTMIETAERLDKQIADRMRRSTTVPNAVAHWAYAIKNHQNIPSEIARLVDIADKERNKIAKDRNDFIHVLFAGDYAAPGVFQPGVQTTSAIRLRTGEKRPTGELRELRDRAATLSCLIAHIDHCMKSSEPSPWRDTVRPLI